MKSAFWPVVSLAAVVILVMIIESVFSFPYIAVMIWLTQLSLLSDEQSIVLGTLFGLFIAVLYHLPLAVGMALFLGVTFIGTSQLWKTQLQTRNGIVALLSMLILITIVHFPMTVPNLIFLCLHFGSVIVLSRIIALRRLRHQ